MGHIGRFVPLFPLRLSPVCRLCLNCHHGRPRLHLLCAVVSSTPTTPLDGIRVLAFTNALAGPDCSMMLGNMGAEVIKVEKPGTGDDSRGYGPFVNGQSGYFVSVNHGKKSVVCNAKDP